MILFVNFGEICLTPEHVKVYVDVNKLCHVKMFYIHVNLYKNRLFYATIPVRYHAVRINNHRKKCVCSILRDNNHIFISIFTYLQILCECDNAYPAIT